ncbi:MAG: 50S ribosomal protein L11 methyltransferase [Prevotella sp.]|nr:50S ribosomal protein L11 methyltransferase [Prevotella sp.]MBQ9651684.1 50S ribosomal protein L11 methyltransferase [Prevotella sp.]
MKYLVANFHITGVEDLQSARDVLASLAGEAGFETFEDSEDGLTAWVQNDHFDQVLLDEIIKSFPFPTAEINYDIADAEDRNWNESWEEAGWEPINIDDQLLLHDTKHSVEDLPENSIDITIDARLAFGTGNHETTLMILRELLHTDLKDSRILDCGCGTGILSIAACKLGAREAVCYDIDEWSVKNTRHNAEINGLNNIEVLHGNASVISHISGVFDVVVANINRNILIDDMEAMRGVVNPGGEIILSGFYVEDGMMLAERAGHLGLRLIRSESKNNWCMLVFTADA